MKTKWKGMEKKEKEGNERETQEKEDKCNKVKRTWTGNRNGKEGRRYQ